MTNPQCSSPASPAREPKPSCTLYAILARDGRSAAVFRRGPGRAVLLLRWWLVGNRVEEGQWLRGRIHEDRCGLSFDGEYLLYFAAKQGRGFGTWTAISRPPYLTALALWPLGDTWGGGGIFLGPRHVALAHRSAKTALAPGFALPKGWRVEPMRAPFLAEPAGRGAYKSAVPSNARDCCATAGRCIPA